MWRIISHSNALKKQHIIAVEDEILGIITFLHAGRCWNILHILHVRYSIWMVMAPSCHPAKPAFIVSALRLVFLGTLADTVIARAPHALGTPWMTIMTINRISERITAYKKSCARHHQNTVIYNWCKGLSVYFRQIEKHFVRQQKKFRGCRIILGLFTISLWKWAP